MKTLIKFIPVFFLLLGAVSCEKEAEIFTPPSFSQILKSTASDSYFIQNSPSSVYKIPIGLSTVSDVDRVVTFTVTSPTGAVEGTHYALSHSNSITIPAGKVIDTLQVMGLFSAYPTGRRDTLVVTLTGGDVEVGGAISTFKLVLQKYCDVNISALNGTYANTRESYTDGSSPYGPYTTVVKDLVMVAGSTTKAEGYVENIYNDGWNDIKIQLDWTDPVAFKATIPLQPTGKNYGGSPTSVRSHSGKANTFSSCDQSFTFTIQLTNAAGTSIIDQDYQVRIRKP
jgi:hypothetical protein